MTTFPISTTAALCAALFAVALPAQFPGDVYLATPGSVVAAGGDVTVRVLTFTGTRRFGAVRLAVAYDPAVLRFDGAALPDGSPLLLSLVPSPGRIAVVTTNAKGIDRPFGIVTLAELTFHAIGSPGSSSSLDLTAFRQIALDGNNVPTQAFGGSVVVTSASSTTLAATVAGAVLSPAPFVVTAAEPVPPSRSEQLAAAGCGRPGARVQLWRLVPRDGRIAALAVTVLLASVATAAPDAVPVRRQRESSDR